MAESWEREYPLLHDLFENSDKAHCNNYFGRFPDQLKCDLARDVYAEWEDRLSLLSRSAWEVLRRKALPYVVQKASDRAWSQLFETLWSAPRKLVHVEWESHEGREGQGDSKDGKT